MVTDQTQFTRDIMGRYVCNPFVTGDYHWDTSPTLGPDEFRPLRTHAHDFTAAA